MLYFYRINIDRLKLMAQIHSYLIMNAKSELTFLSDEITSEELEETLNQVTLAITNGIDLFDNDKPETDINIDFENISEVEEIVNLEAENYHELELTNVIDLSTSLLNHGDNLTDQEEEESSIMNHGDLDFDVDALINSFDAI